MKKILYIGLSFCLLVLSSYSLFGQSTDEDFVKDFSLNPGKNFDKTGLRKFINYDSSLPVYIGILKAPSNINRLRSEGLNIKRVLSNTCLVIYIKDKPADRIVNYFQSLFPANNLWKLSPPLLKEYVKNNKSFNDFSYLLYADDVTKIPSGLKVQANSKLLSITLKGVELSQFVNDDNIIYIQKASPQPKEELAVNGFDNTVNKINLAHHYWPGINGSGTTISIKENLFDTADIDFKNRVLKTSISSPVYSSHASYMATIVGGGGNTFYTGKGAAWATTLSSSDFANLLPDPSSFFQQNNIVLQNHSYGTVIENFYGAEAVAYDVQANTNPSLLHVFSAGNRGTEAGTQTYAGINGYANTTGNFKMAKNIITVGHIDSFGTVLPLSSRGPAFDGRVKPELVAYAEDGSSGAAAIVSGISLLLQQVYKEMNGTMPPSALIRAVLFNSADDVEAKAIDYVSGYGSVNAYRAIKTLKENRIISGAVGNGNTSSISLTIPANAVNLKVTLSWNDPAAQPNSFKALVNDLDLELIELSTGNIYKPWVLNSAANLSSLSELAIRNRDSLNNTEQITVDAPAGGDYLIKVNGFSVALGAQSFFIAWQCDTLNHFQWNYPTGSDNIFSGQNNLIRWENTYISTGKLEYSINNGLSWNLVNDNIDLSKQNFYWSAPDTFCTALLRMFAGNEIYQSDTFSLSTIIPTGVGFNCSDSAMIYWKKIKGVTGYRVYSLGSQYLQPYAVTVDTFLVIKKNLSSSLHFTVAPLFTNTKAGLKAYTFNYSTQGVECFLKNLLVDLIDKTGKVQVLMGTLYNVKSICIEKSIAGNYVCIKSFTPNGNLNYLYDDNNLIKGGNTYRVKIELNNGQFVTSYDVTIYYFDNNEFLIFPNPVKREEGFSVLSSSLEPSFLQLYAVTGQRVYQQPLRNFSEKVNTAAFQKGLYFYVITRDDKKLVTGKIIIQ